MPGCGDSGCVSRTWAGGGGTRLVEEAHRRLCRLSGDTGAIGKDRWSRWAAGWRTAWGGRRATYGSSAADGGADGQLRSSAPEDGGDPSDCAHAPAKSRLEMGGSGGSNRGRTAGLGECERIAPISRAISTAGAGCGESRGSRTPRTSGRVGERAGAAESTGRSGEQTVAARIEREAPIRSPSGGKPHAAIQRALREDESPRPRRKWPDP